MSSTSRQVKLNDGRYIPALGYGTGTAWYGAKGPDGGISQELVDATTLALKTGFVHLDSAESYANAKSVGVALKEQGVSEAKKGGSGPEVWVTTKAEKGIKDLRGTLEAELSSLQIPYVDLYMLHVPTFTEWGPEYPSIQQAWKTMEELHKDGLARSIGVSNFRIRDLEELLTTAKVKPAMNQIEVNPYVWKEAKPLIDFCRKENIAIAAYGSQTALTHRQKGGPLDPIISRIATAHNITPGQVLLKWVAKRVEIQLTTSGKEERMKEALNLDQAEELTEEEDQEIERVGIEGGVRRSFQQHMSK